MLQRTRQEMIYSELLELWCPIRLWILPFLWKRSFRVSQFHHRGGFSTSNRSGRMNFNGWSTQGLYFLHSHVTFFVVLCTSLVLMFICGRYKPTVTKILKLQIHYIKSRNISSFVPWNMKHYEKHLKRKLQILMSYLLYTSYKRSVVQCTGIEETGLSLM